MRRQTDGGAGFGLNMKFQTSLKCAVSLFLPQGGVSEADRNMTQTSLSQSDHSVVVDTLLHNAIKVLLLV